MQLIDMLFDEIEDAKRRKVPFIIPIGTIEYHAHHASCGCDTMVINGIFRELEKTKEEMCIRDRENIKDYDWKNWKWLG